MLGQPLDEERATIATSSGSAFEGYLVASGNTTIHFNELPDNAETVGVIERVEVRGPNGRKFRVTARRPAAVELTGKGRFYLLPFRRQEKEQLIKPGAAAVLEHREQQSLVMPAFLENGPTLVEEDELSSQITETTAALDDLTRRREELRRLRLMIGRSQDDELVQLVARALRIVLDGSDYHVDMREDENIEDVWLVGPDSDFAIGEVKGINRHVGMGDTGQADAHRGQREIRPQDMPAFGIYNVLRLANELEKRKLPVAGKTITDAVYRNVLVLRTWDLFELVAWKQLGNDAAEELVKALASRGGWLEVDRDSGPQLHQQ